MRKNIVRTSGAVIAIAAISIGAVACGDNNGSSGSAGGDTSTTSTMATAGTTGSSSTMDTTGSAGTTGTTGGSSTSTGQGRTGAPADGTSETSPQSNSAGQSNATATLGKPQEMAITVPSTIKAGKVTFDVTNSGAAPHEFVILKTQTKAADLPTQGGKAKETGLVDRTDEIAPGDSATVEVTLKPGHYVVLCNLPGHYQAGMRKDLTVQ